MKSIYVHFEDDEFEKLLEVKKDLSWRNFIISLAEEYTKAFEEEDK